MCSLGQVPLLSGLPSLSIKWGCELRRIVTGMSVSSAPLGQSAGGFLTVYWGPVHTSLHSPRPVTRIDGA